MLLKELKKHEVACRRRRRVPARDPRLEVVEHCCICRLDKPPLSGVKSFTKRTSNPRICQHVHKAPLEAVHEVREAAPHLCRDIKRHNLVHAVLHLAKDALYVVRRAQRMRISREAQRGNARVDGGAILRFSGHDRHFGKHEESRDERDVLIDNIKGHRAALRWTPFCSCTEILGKFHK